jgi:hypothetical protein
VHKRQQRKAFTCNLVTIRSKKSFGEVTNAIENMFQRFDLDKLRKLTEAKDAKAVAQYVEQVSKPHPFSLFFKFDQGSIFRLAGIPIESRFYLFGNATIALQVLSGFGTWSTRPLLRFSA